MGQNFWGETGQSHFTSPPLLSHFSHCCGSSGTMDSQYSRHYIALNVITNDRLVLLIQLKSLVLVVSYYGFNAENASVLQVESSQRCRGIIIEKLSLEKSLMLLCCPTFSRLLSHFTQHCPNLTRKGHHSFKWLLLYFVVQTVSVGINFAEKW